MSVKRRSAKYSDYYPRDIKCVVVGDGGVGKTSMLVRHTSGGFLSDYVPTCFDSYNVVETIQDREIRMCVIDTAGQETYDRLRTLSYYDTDVFIVCFSVDCQDSFSNVRNKWIPEIIEYQPNSHYFLVGTQLDLRNEPGHKEEDFITQRQGVKLARQTKSKGYLECSALTGEGLDQVFTKALLVACNIKPKKKRKFWKQIRSVFIKR